MVKARSTRACCVAKKIDVDVFPGSSRGVRCSYSFPKAAIVLGVLASGDLATRGRYAPSRNNFMTAAELIAKTVRQSRAKQLKAELRGIHR